MTDYPTKGDLFDILGQLIADIEGWTLEHDDEHGGGELSDAAAAIKAIRG